MITTAELTAAMSHIAAAPKTDGSITGLCLRPGYGERQFPQSITMTRAGGMPGERWATAPWMKLADGSPDPRIQISILSTRVCDMVWRQGDAAPHPGDPVVADIDTSHANMPAGTLLQLGTAIVRVSDLFNEACVKWKTRYGADAKKWVTDYPELRLRGVLCEVVQDGNVTLADRVVKL